ncbi:hypothetical protein JTE90_023413 [Oedothorax gibbosus]|uniref:ISXO2-like transposase domain-containing protein n=1 Tax=Oedothorax gibbosus TaxID=931172 RepID=A0AAV6TU64_9ARAC|nr:hypothetical protein JTE90_023413 [Oedothorax gibbosus]
MATKSGITGRINSFFFAQMYVEGQREDVCNKNCIDWCVKAGLLPSSYECPGCKESMQLKKRKGKGDNWEWRCRNMTHEVKRSIRKGTWFEKSKLSIPEILLMTWFWINKYRPLTIKNEIDCASNTISEWFTLCRDVCVKVCINTSEKLGGPGKVVEFEEGKYGTKNPRQERKEGKQENPEEGEWVYVGLERETDRCFFVVKPVRNKESLYHTLRDWILPGTTIMTDLWSVFDCLEDEDFQVLKDMNDLKFKTPDYGGSYNAIEGAGIKRGLKGHSQFKDHADGHLAEYMWRCKNSAEIQRLFLAFVEAIVSIYPPQTADV